MTTIAPLAFARCARAALLTLAPCLACLSTPAAAAADCTPKGFDICQRSTQFASWLNSERPANGKYFRISRAVAEGGSITVFFTFNGDKSAMRDLLERTHKTQSQFQAALESVAKDSACKEPARSIVVNGGKFTAVYEYPDRSSFLKRTVEGC